ncbi:Cytochrome b [Gulbenkiania indica]|uniref:Cytochrome b n=2 Tax=Gulbenkiania indica TaxID=375574 RepID=A0A0K6GTD6_9NEIS|nr:Cytochrome b [Gulbenkiania indica]
MSTVHAPTVEVRVWDPFVRLFHWLLVAGVSANLFVLEEGDPPHRWVGYVATALVLARIVWGFIGTHHARFADFWPTRRRLRAHLVRLRAHQADPSPGHNPMGALMMLALMALVLALGFTGWLMGTDAYWGEEWLESLHEGLANTLMGLAGMHVLAAVVMSRLERVNLVRAMITGVKRYPANRTPH